MFVSVQPEIAFPLMLDPYWNPRGLGATAPLPVSTMAEDAAATALATAAAITPPPADVILAAAAGVAKILASLGIGAGCGQACIQATDIVNQAEPAFLANVQQYESGQISQAQAIATYNNLWQAMTVACSAIPGQPGKDCISDRQEGACTWKQTADGDTLGLPGVPAVGDCWNWYSGYYLPLTYPALTPMQTSVASDALSTVGTAATQVATSLGLPSGSGMLLLAAAALLVGIVVLK